MDDDFYCNIEENNILEMKTNRQVEIEGVNNLDPAVVNSIPRWSKIAFQNGATLIVLKEGNFQDTLDKYDIQKISINQDSKILAYWILSDIITSITKDKSQQKDTEDSLHKNTQEDARQNQSKYIFSLFW